MGIFLFNGLICVVGALQELIISGDNFKIFFLGIVTKRNSIETKIAPSYDVSMYIHTFIVYYQNGSFKYIRRMKSLTKSSGEMFFSISFFI